MDPGPGRGADALLHHVDEGGDVVVGDPLALLDRGRRRRGPLPHGGGVGGRDDAELGPGLDGQDLDLEPRAVAGLVGEEVGHGSEGVAGDQVLVASVPKL